MCCAVCWRPWRACSVLLEVLEVVRRMLRRMLHMLDVLKSVRVCCPVCRRPCMLSNSANKSSTNILDTGGCTYNGLAVKCSIQH